MSDKKEPFENFSVVQQQLIDARDSLDAQVTRLKRIHEFISSALNYDTEASYTVAVAESIVDIFEYEFGICWSFAEASGTVKASGILGLDIPEETLLEVAARLYRILETEFQNTRISPELLELLQQDLPIAQGNLMVCRNSEDTPIAIILGGNTRYAANFYGAATAELDESFILFASQVSSILEMQRRRDSFQSLNNNLSAILQAIPDLLFELDESGLYINVWAQDESLLAKEKKALLGHTVKEILHPAAAETVLAALEIAKRQGASYGKTIWLNLEGVIHWFELSVTRKDQEPGAANFIVLSRDITERKHAQDLLRERDARFKTLFESTDAISVQGYDVNRRVIYWNPASEKLYGIAAQDAIGNKLEDLIIPDEMRQAVIDGVSAWVEKGISIPSSELVLQKGDGSPVNVFSSHVMLYSSDGSPEMYCIDVDLTKQKEAIEQVQLLSMAVEQSPVSVVITDCDGNIEYVNKSFERISGYTAEEVIGQNPRIFQSGKTQKSVYENLWDTIASGKPWHGQLQNKTKNGKIIWENVHIAPVMNEEGKVHHYLAVKEDISVQKQQEETILNQAHFDNLTKLPNRFLCLDRLAQSLIDAQRNKERVAVLFIDLDDFKKINDTMGHEMGDMLLVDAASRLRSSVRAGDTVGRLGGDEFFVMLGGIREMGDVRSVAETMLTNFREVFNIANRELLLTLSAGVAIYPDDGETPSELLKNADSAMYHAKQLGRNTYAFFTESMNKDVMRRLHIEELMQNALQRDEFEVLYQPQYSINDSQICGAEALLRWHNPELGAISPAEFIQIAEHTGKIIALGNFVLNEALRMAKQWQKYNEDFKIAVNLSPSQFRDPGLVDSIENILHESGFPSNQLELEITEGVLMSGHSHIHDALDRLSALNVIISMDDFGTGYSSLSYLRSYPFNVLKIDRTFVNDIDVDRADMELVNCAIAMGHGLGLDIVAEGVETQKQLTILSGLQCDFAQGYFFSKPLSAQQFTELLNSNS